MPIEAFGIFEGGGAKGLAHIGALKATEERAIKFIGVAGTSAGSIVASLIAVGYSADELYNPSVQNVDKGIFDKDFLDFFGGEEGWNEFLNFKDQVEKTFDNFNVLVLPKAFCFYINNKKYLNQLLENQGLYSTKEFAQWLDEQLAKGLAKNQDVDISQIHRPVRFQDTLIPLKIIATNLTERKIIVYPQLNMEEMSIAEAVAASISIPIFFEPKQNQDLLLLDGGLLSNFPAWVFDEERENSDLNTPTFGFKLVEDQSFTNPISLFSYVRSLLATAISGDELLETRRIENLCIVRIKTIKSTFDFKLSSEEKDSLYRCGTEGTRNYFSRYTGNPFNSSLIEPMLQSLFESIQFRINSNNLHLRINVMLPDSKGRLRIFYSYNMDNDADDQLYISQDSLGAGECLRTGSLVISDVRNIRDQANKYIKALLRPNLITLISVPIPDVRKKPDENGDYIDFLGVLNVDSDDELFMDFENIELQQVLLDQAVIIAKLLTGVLE